MSTAEDCKPIREKAWRFGTAGCRAGRAAWLCLILFCDQLAGQDWPGRATTNPVDPSRVRPAEFPSLVEPVDVPPEDQSYFHAPASPNWLSQPSAKFGPHADTVVIPEPLLFDLVRPLGARKGELEFNTLAVFPWKITNRDLTVDPFGSGPTTPDRKGIEWAPEVEYAIADNFAIEFEFPFEDSVLEEYKLGLQWTIGTAFQNHYIHGFQVLIEPTPEWEQWNSTLLYIGGVRFSETWSTLFMFGGRMNLEGPSNFESFERLVNATLYADLTDETTLGLETNFASNLDGGSNFIIVPQIHQEFGEHIEIQMGIGLGVSDQGSEQSFILRGIYVP